MKNVIHRLREAPLTTLSKWQNTRTPWAIIAVTMISMVLVAHYVFQNWLHMLPCEQCVYIRYGNLVVALGAIIALINPRSLWTKILAYTVSFYGLIYTAICSIKLINIHNAVHSDDPTAVFGMQGCSLEPIYPFRLPLAKLAPDWFQPTGDCGYDAPMVPDGVELSSLQAWFINLYQEYDGWYLIPQWKFLNMAECCLIACAMVALFLVPMCFAWIVKRNDISYIR